MRKVQIEVKFLIKEQVFRLSDPDKMLFFVIGYTIDSQGVMYKIHGEAGVVYVYDYEIESYEYRLGVLN
jgi:hypothetical protein